MVKRASIEHWWLRILLAIILASCFGVQSATNQTRPQTRKTEPISQPTQVASPVASPNPLIIATPQVATESIQLNQKLRSLPDRLVSNESLTEIEQEIDELKETANQRASETELAIQSGAIFAELQQSSLDWQALSKQVEGLSDRLTTHATALENEIQSLRSDESRWLATNQAFKSQASPPELLDLTGKALADISAALKASDERRGRVVALQQSIATQSSTIATEIEHLRKAMSESQRSLLEPDSAPLWKVQGASQSEDSLTRFLQSSYAEDVPRVKAFIRAERKALVFITILTILALGFLVRLSRTAAQTAETDPKKTYLILQRPVSLSLLVFLVAMMPLLYGAPLTVIGLVNLIGMVPVLRLLKPRLSKHSQRMLVVLIGSVLLWHLIKAVQFPVWFKRGLLAVFTLSVIVAFIWLVRETQRSAQHQQRGPTLALMGSYVGIVLLSLAFFANVFGYVRLSDLLTQGTLASAYRAVALYNVLVVGSLLITFALQTKATQRLAMFRTGNDRVARRLSFALGVIVFLVWCHTALSLFTIRADVYAEITSALNYQITIGSVSFAVSNIVAFVLTLFFGYLVASLTRAILGEEILPRLHLARGLPNAIATVTHYVILVLVFVLALAAAGVELSKFTILTGAIGVGLGFGLQNIVNNFVSGLILLFERPVRVGDLLEIGGVSGQVTKIGFRASTVHAFEGSDLIIPNATLISEQVTNWTLTGTHRQISLNIHVAYGNDPTQVRDLLRTTATAHPDVLDFPKPTALFLGFGNTSLNFEVLFWAARPEVAPELKSDVALSIAAALSEAGIKVPVPQPDLRVTTTDETEKGAAATSAKDGG